MHGLLLTLQVALLGLLAIWFQVTSPVQGLLIHRRDDLHESFHSFRIVHASTLNRRASDDGSSTWEIRLHAGGGEIIIVDVTPNTDLVRDITYGHLTDDEAAAIDHDNVLIGIVKGQPDSTVRLTKIRDGLYEGRVVYRRVRKSRHGAAQPGTTQTSDGPSDTASEPTEIAGEWRSLNFEIVPSASGGDDEFDMITYSDDDVTDHFNGTATCGTVEPPVMGSVPDPFFQNSYADQMISSANPDDGTAETDFIDEVRDGCDAEGGNCHPVSSLHRRAVVSGKGRDCPIAVIADYKFYSTFGDDSEMAVLSLFNEVDSIYSQTVNVRTPVSYIYVVKNVTDASGFGKPAADAESLLSQLATAVAGRKIPKLPTNVCLTHLLTVQDFNPTLGLAYVGKQGMAGGICSGGGYNTGISTPMYGTKLIARSTYITTVTHELGHGMGSAHDTQHPTPPGNPASCNPAQPYIMYPSASTSTNWRTFSNCSLYSIGAALNSIASCFITRNSLKGLAENSTADVWYTEKIKYEDQCKVATGLANTPSGGYSDCPLAMPTSYACNLVCVNPSNPTRCLVFPDAQGRLRNKTDGSLCGAFNDQTQVCMKGQCVKDIRANVCDRRKPCCNPYGVLRNSTYQCSDGFTCTQPASCTGKSADCPIVLKPQATRCNLTSIGCGTTKSTNADCGRCSSDGKCLAVSQASGTEDETTDIGSAATDQGSGQAAAQAPDPGTSAPPAAPPASNDGPLGGGTAGTKDTPQAGTGSGAKFSTTAVVTSGLVVGGLAVGGVAFFVRRRHGANLRSVAVVASASQASKDALEADRSADEV